MLNVSSAAVWVTSIEDQAGGLMAKLEALAKAGADLEFILARRTPEAPGKGVVFVTPLRGSAQEAAASAAGFHQTQSLHSLRVEGPDEPGMGYRVTRALAEEGINLRGVSAAALSHQFVFYLAFDSAAEAERARARLERSL